MGEFKHTCTIKCCTVASYNHKHLFTSETTWRSDWMIESRYDVLARTNSPMELLPLTAMNGHFCCSATGGRAAVNLRLLCRLLSCHQELHSCDIQQGAAAHLLHWLAATVDLQLLQHSTQRNINIILTRTTRHGMLLRPQEAGQQHTFHNCILQAASMSTYRARHVQ